MNPTKDPKKVSTCKEKKLTLKYGVKEKRLSLISTDLQQSATAISTPLQPMQVLITIICNVPWVSHPWHIYPRHHSFLLAAIAAS
jgi:DNA segregation ATPase FtsK/SpoIIIE-like protein